MLEWFEELVRENEREALEQFDTLPLSIKEIIWECGEPVDGMLYLFRILDRRGEKAALEYLRIIFGRRC